MSLKLASLLLAALAFGAAPSLAAPSLAAAPTEAPPAANAGPALAPDAAQPAPGDDDGGDDTANPAPAPVPDPFVAEMLKTCRDGASGDKGTYQRLQDAGWGVTVDGDTQTAFYQSFSGEKDYDGVGTVDITYSLEVYPTMTEGYCSVSIDTALRKIGIVDLQNVADLKGEVRETPDGVASNWEDNGATPTSFIQADQHNQDLYFILDVTTLLQKPAADIPHVEPAATDDPGMDSPDDGASDSTNAGD